jgi:molybdenum cofactor biosynthesis protein B
MAERRHRESDLKASLAVLTVSDTRTEEDDGSGALIRELLEGSGHRVIGYRVVPDEPAVVMEELQRLLGIEGCRGVLVNGGTGISPRDRTYEAVTAILDMRLEGFGELFRMLSYREIGSSAMASRAVAGVASGRLLFSMPGSTAAVRLAMEELILPQLGHLLFELAKDR